MRAHPLGALLLGFVLASCGSEEVPQGPRELPDAAPLDQAPPLRGSEPSLSPDLGSEPPLRADTVGGGEGSVRGLIEQAGLDEELASSLEGSSEEPSMDTMREVCRPVGLRAMASAWPLLYRPECSRLWMWLRVLVCSSVFQ